MTAPDMRPTTARSPDERVAVGRAARRRARRAGHADWDPPAHRADPVDVLEHQAAQRVADLVPIRYGRMLASELAFFRGAAAVMAADLAATPRSGLLVQACGDAHLSNFGGFQSPERALVFDVNDFDETAPGPWEWDVKRLATSLAVAGRSRGFTDAERRAVVTGTVRQYREAMAEFAAQRDLQVWYARLDTTLLLARWRAAVRQKAVRSRLARGAARAGHRDHLGALAKLTVTVDGRSRFASRSPLLVPIEELVADPVAGAEVFQEALRQYREALQPDRRDLLRSFTYAHAARKVVGVGSVGTRAWVVLLTGRDGGDPLILQFKEAQRSVLEPFAGAGASAYVNQGRRVVEGQRRMQAASDIFLGWVRATGVDGVPRDYYGRQLWDGKLSADVERMPPVLMALYGRMCGWTLARAHARSGDRIALAAYLGRSARFDLAVAEFAERYADQNAADHAALVAAVRDGRVSARFGI